MSDNNKSLRESLELIIKANKEELLDDSFLIKAREAFERATGYKPNKRNILSKAKTFKQFLAGEEPDEKLMKALQEGQTKVKNGITYVVKKTKGGKLDWRRVTKPAKKQVQVEDDPDFPNSLDDLTFVSNLGGSTGAKLMEDKVTGDKFVVKMGASKEHLREEWLAHELYEELGINVPLARIYDEDSDSPAMVSQFMENTVDANSIMDDNLKEEIMKNYVADCLLANWDIYCNDNILVNKDDGLVYRVDNGGSLRYSATGREKGEDFTDEVDELDSMIFQNQMITAGLTQDDINAQIKFVLKKEKAILKLITDKDLKVKMTKRFFDLSQRVEDFENNSKDPYRELSEKDLNKALKKANGDMRDINSDTGWTFLSEICKMRGFDGLPEQVSSAEFDLLLADNKTKLLQRGLTGNRGNTAKKYMKDFTENKDCFYGTVGMYGAGIYAAVNATKKDPPPPNADYQIAYEYADREKEHIIDIALTSDVKVVDADELDKQMYEEFFGPEFQEKKKEYDAQNEIYQEKEQYAQNIEKIIEDEMRDEMGWNDKVLTALGSKAEVVYADPEIHSFNKVVTYYTAIVNQLKGKVQKIDDKNYEVTLPNSPDTFMLSEDIAGRSVKQKNDISDKYNLHYKYFKEHIINNHYKKINEAIKGVQKDDDRIKQAHIDAKEAKAKLSAISDEIDKVSKDGNSAITGILAQIAKRPNGEFRGFYAAIKGYDAIIQKNGWGQDTDFAVILNRSKMIVRKK